MNSRIAVLVIAVSFLCDATLAQSAPNTSAQPSSADSSQPSDSARSVDPAKKNEDRNTENRTTEKREHSQRLGGFLPQFGVVDGPSAPPLTSKGKFRLFYKSAIDPAAFVVSGLTAGIGQAQDSFPAYGQGATGFAKRYGAAFADQASSTFFSTYFYPVLLKADPRYFRMGEGSVKHRFAHAVGQEFIAHKDSGGQTFNWSNTLGALTAGGISNAYYPSADRGLELTMGRVGIALVYGTLGGVGSEFWPDISRKLHRHKKDEGLPDRKVQN
jgi:hypothetical protein